MNAPFLDTAAFGEPTTLLVALGIGILFGWFLERGGMGSARKLSGQFYFTDMTVLKVMFSAIVTALLGSFWLDRLGVLDLSRVYVPETFLLPQIVGGLVFGVGFVVGGLCPGTSCVAASTGRKDGIAVLLGMLVGVFVFHEAFPVIERFYLSTPRGAFTLDAAFGISRGAAVLLVVGGALAAFAAAEMIERRTARKA